MCMYIYILYTHNVFSTSTSWLLCFGCRFHDVHNVITVIKGTLDQTFGANTGWIWRTSLKQFGVWGDILQRLLPIHIYKICFQSLPGNIVASPFFYAPPPSSKPIDPSLTQLSCNKANVIDHCCPLLQASRLTCWLSGRTKYEPGNQWKLRGFLISPYLN